MDMDLVNDKEKTMQQKMLNAAEEDRQLNTECKPAAKELTILQVQHQMSAQESSKTAPGMDMDLINDKEYLVVEFQQTMQDAAEEDRQLNTECKPAAKELTILQVQHQMSAQESSKTAQGMDMDLINDKENGVVEFQQTMLDAAEEGRQLNTECKPASKELAILQVQHQMSAQESSKTAQGMDMDLINDKENVVMEFQQTMLDAAEEDRQLNTECKPASKELAILQVQHQMSAQESSKTDMDLINDKEYLVVELQQAMLAAAEEDRQLNTECKPAAKELAILQVQHQMSAQESSKTAQGMDMDLINDKENVVVEFQQTMLDAAEEDRQLNRECKPVSKEHAILQVQHQMNAQESSKTAQYTDMDLITDENQIIVALLQKMQHAAEEDRQLDTECKPTTKKLAILRHSMSLLIKKDLHPAFIEHNVLNVLTDWLTPLRTTMLPCMQIRENILNLLADFPAMDKELVEKSGIGQAVMCLHQHPKETNANRARAGRLIAAWNLSTSLMESTPTTSTSALKENFPSVEDNRGAISPAKKVRKPCYKEYIVQPAPNIDADNGIVLKFSKIKKKRPLSSRERIYQNLLNLKRQNKPHSLGDLSIRGNTKKP